MRVPGAVVSALAVALLLPTPARAGLGEDLARCQSSVWRPALPQLGRAARLHPDPRYRVDRYEAYQAWVLRRNEYDECRRLTRSGCSDPGPAPQ